MTSTVVRPAINGLIPQVVDRADELTAANSVYSLVEAMGSLLGPLFAGLVLSHASETGTYAAAAPVFALAAALSMLIRTDFQPADHEQRLGWRRVVEPLRGFPALLATRALRSVFAIFMCQSLLRGFLNVFVIAMAISLLDGDVNASGVLFAALGAGGLLGALLTLSGVAWPPAATFAIGMTFWGAPLLLIAGLPHAVVAWAAIALIGAGNAVADVFGFTLFHRLVPDHLLGRAFGAFWGGAAATQALGAVLATPLITHTSLRAALAITGGLMLLVIAVSWPALRGPDAGLSVDDDRVSVLQRCPVLAPLTRLVLEQLAREAEPVAVAAGTVVMTQGDLGETFYVVVDGELTARVGERIARTMSASDCFGEIAALNHTPRTATVVADRDCTLLALDGPTFVLAVTGHRPAKGAALGLSRQRLESDHRD